MSIVRDITIIIVVLVASFIVHELGHLIVGAFLGYKAVAFDMNLSFFGVWFYGGYPLLSMFFFVRIAGGVFQAIFLFIIADLMPRFRFEFNTAAWIFIGYAILEGLMII